ncbi:MAG: hypothetical protein LBP58_06945 [Azoarcus sp.]|jgi:hypothetical protein|nr:hypothetical protein [Azoarcus sp.]
MTENALPSQDPADDGSLAGVLRATFKKMMQTVDGMLPARVIAYDRASNTATVQPMIQIVSTSGERVSRAPLASVPVLALGGGGFALNFPLKPGNMGWIEASDRDISLYMQGAQAESAPNTQRMHTFSDGRFIPDVFGGYTLSGDDDQDADMVIQTLDGSTRIVLTPDSIKIIAAKNVTIEAAEKLDLTAGQAITLNAPQIGATSSGGATITGPVNINGTTTIQGREFISHVHTGVQPGSGNTGGVK